MTKIPADLKYTSSHEWLRTLADGTIKVGITDSAQQALGDLVFVEVPEAGRALQSGEPCAVVESVKAASDVYSPVTGEVIEGNPRLAGAPELVNEQPYDDGWLLHVRPTPGGNATTLLSAAEYEKLLQTQGD
jgi:glycine cleavage system H protein